MRAWFRPICWLAVPCLFGCGLLAAALALAGPAYTDPDKTDDDFPLQGEYKGTLKDKDGDGEITIGLQVVALGKGQFRGYGYQGGLPGDGADISTKVMVEGKREGDQILFTRDEGSAVVKGGTATVSIKGVEVGVLPKVLRESPTLGAKPPKEATVLFDGKNTDHWENGKIENGLLVAGTQTKKKFGDQKIHIEFRIPYQPEDDSQGRGNSGIYLQGRYEVQMLDSFGLEGKHNECGGIYSVRDPNVNMALPPLSWQTYDIDYTAGKYDDAGKVVSNPRITVIHNGVKIHDNVELPGDRNTTAAPVQPGNAPGPIYLQDHGNPVRYRNIWVVEKK